MSISSLSSSSSPLSSQFSSFSFLHYSVLPCLFPLLLWHKNGLLNWALGLCAVFYASCCTYGFTQDFYLRDNKACVPTHQHQTRFTFLRPFLFKNNIYYNSSVSLLTINLCSYLSIKSIFSSLLFHYILSNFIFDDTRLFLSYALLRIIVCLLPVRKHRDLAQPTSVYYNLLL